MLLKKALTMKMTKKNSFIAVLLLAVTFNACSMDQPEPVEQTSSWSKWVGDVLAGVTGLGQLWQQPQPINSFAFTRLPKELQDEIITLLSINTTAESLEVAAYTINALAQVNRELNERINSPEFCLNLIKSLSKRFNCSNYDACKSLQTKEAKRRLRLQQDLRYLCEFGESLGNDNLSDLCIKGVDLEFSYPAIPNSHGTLTPLMLVSTYGRMAILMGTALLPNGANINGTNEAGVTALMQALNFLTKPKLNAEIWTLRVQQFLNAGADPEIANNDGLTPLQAAQKTGKQEIIDLIQDAIDKKHGKK